MQTERSSRKSSAKLQQNSITPKAPSQSVTPKNITVQTPFSERKVTPQRQVCLRIPNKATNSSTTTPSTAKHQETSKLRLTSQS